MEGAQNIEIPAWWPRLVKESTEALGLAPIPMDSVSGGDTFKEGVPLASLVPSNRVPKMNARDVKKLVRGDIAGLASSDDSGHAGMMGIPRIIAVPAIPGSFLEPEIRSEANSLSFAAPSR